MGLRGWEVKVGVVRFCKRGYMCVLEERRRLGFGELEW